ncbi:MULTISPECIES: transporter substrate-binding domain-containing protein [unclassified Salinivibrio]|uniref:transporter substrate-binding domain-containing protein n=1 Tax=unclassified Salinivibrio TaxID=2636825 RepID=UPI000986706A|nr:MULTISPECIES: transporter substrate-binding domain-containing protein [unclassified Salinivibrio]OOF13080.1 ectoine/hydroxyectoine ABC transporter substrate-binding protein EhuB [Salinivibrio sp. PR919]OOF17260.1 ectoine/hydroxyectoine ABC transporter substrate-binding protein EhuB [Salinivibrio sp. PR932]
MRQIVIIIASLLLISTVSAETLNARIEAGKPVRLGFANEKPWAYLDSDGKPTGLINDYTIDILKRMGISQIEPVFTEWGGLIPGLRAKRFDIITGGMYILGSRCQKIAFSEPIGRFRDAFIVPKGNPKDIHDYPDVVRESARLVTGVGYNMVTSARDAGLSESLIIQVPGPTEILSAVKEGRAEVGAVPYFTALYLAKQAPDSISVSDPARATSQTGHYIGIGFRKEDNAFVERFDEVQAKYMGSPQMLEQVKKYGYREAQYPDGIATSRLCQRQ